MRALILIEDSSPDRRWRRFGVPTRHLAPVANKALVAHAVDELRHAGVEEIAILTDDRGRAAIEPALAEELHDGAPVSYLARERGQGLAAGLLDAGSFALDSPLIVHSGDGVLAPTLSGLLDKFLPEELDALLVAERPPGNDRTESRRWTGASGSGRPLAHGISFSGLCIIGPLAARAAKEASHQGVRSSVFDFLAALHDLDARVDCKVVEGWCACSEPKDLLRATRGALENLEPFTSLAADTTLGAEIEGRVLVHPTSEIDRSQIRGPVVIGPRARISHSVVGPYASVGEDAIIEGAELTNSVILSGAKVTHPPGRIESSILGPEARVTSGYDLPRGLRLTLGVGGEVVFS